MSVMEMTNPCIHFVTNISINLSQFLSCPIMLQLATHMKRTDDKIMVYHTFQFIYNIFRR